eukprot:CAMPEP_0185579742 /NCGR_PEP_ID=MMETSP0434-20130131/15388_1 /TAXON_ID=626734 ORGANISM="Favella taraikaensis, Strain Fe Narragansett Bay" /NCGR_SAMPLE_ID=MMETSP0434 /ASSEMBLY_ACC=CAM_ASM_000379 /LENGTH=86 /DNA_ID=CAMNT_0028197833 /DNA_START=717 /DNA_END=976 /DNA_ORIENTATION=-
MAKQIIIATSSIGIMGSLKQAARQDANPESPCLEEHGLNCERNELEAEVKEEEGNLAEERSPEESVLGVPRELREGVVALLRQLKT